MKCNGRHHTSAIGVLTDCLCLSKNGGRALVEVMLANRTLKAAEAEQRSTYRPRYSPPTFGDRYGWNRGRGSISRKPPGGKPNTVGG